MVIISLALLSCNVAHKASNRETIFDKIVSIPKTLILDIPKLPPLCDEIPGLKKGFVDVKNGQLYYEEEGHGIPLVLLNSGPGGSHHHYHPHFSKMSDVARVIYYDARGTGKSSVDDTGKTYTIRQAVEDIESLRKALGIEKWAILGWSFGGFLAQCYALTYPEHITGLILVAASDGLKKVEMKPSRQLMFISKEEKDAIQKIYANKNANKLTLEQAVYNAHLAGDWKRQSYYKPTPDEFIRTTLYEWTPAPGFRELICSDESKIGLDNKFNDFEIPTLICEGRWDLTWNTDKVDFMRKNHPRAQVEYFKSSGHQIFADEPEKFFKLLKDFLEKSNKIQIVYKPGNRLIWPQPPSELVCAMLMTLALPNDEKKLDKVVEIYQQAITKNNQDPELWEQFFFAFFRKKGYAEKALEALQRYEHLAKKQDPEALSAYGHCIKVWRGQLLDSLGKRNEAIKYYREILQNFKGVNEHCSDIDRKWLEDHLKNPFTLD